MSLQQRLTNFGFACTFSYDVGGQERSRADAFITLLLFIDRSSGGDRGRVRKKGIGKMPVNIDVLWKLLILTKYFRGVHSYTCFVKTNITLTLSTVLQVDTTADTRVVDSVAYLPTLDGTRPASNKRILSIWIQWKCVQKSTFPRSVSAATVVSVHVCDGAIVLRVRYNVVELDRCSTPFGRLLCCRPETVIWICSARWVKCHFGSREELY